MGTTTNLKWGFVMKKNDIEKKIKKMLEEYIESGHKTGLTLEEFVIRNHPDIYGAYLKDVNKA